jgi:pimeloyl-ACP methyl ester carboxylesterase
MSRTTSSETILVTGAYQNMRSSCASEHIIKAGITAVKRSCAFTSGIESQAEDILAYIKQRQRPVNVIGLSIGALVAYRMHHKATKGVIPRTALINSGCIGEPMPALEMTLDPVKLFFGFMDVFTNPESPKALREASAGEVQIGHRTQDLVMLAGSHDRVIPRDLSQRTAERIGARLIMLDGGHHLLRDDVDGVMLKVLMSWFKTGKGLRKLPNISIPDALVPA